MQYGIRYTILGSEVVSPVSRPDLAVAIASSWSQKIHPDATAVVRAGEEYDWVEYEGILNDD